MSARGLVIRASGMVTSVGYRAASSCAAMRAGIRNVNEANLWDPESGSYLAAGKVALPHWWIGVGKLAELCAPALRECFVAAQPTPPEEIPVLLGVAAHSRPCRLPDLDDELIVEIEHRLGTTLHPSSRLIARERVSIVDAFEESVRLIQAGVATQCIVAGVDSLVQNDLCDHYLAMRRLLTPKNSNGFSPGEAAGALLVGGSGSPGDLQILGVGVARETATIESEEPLRAEGLIRAVAEALDDARCAIGAVDYRISDLNGEHYRFKEMAFAMMRHDRQPRARLFDLWHPSEFIGDVGAAIGAVAFGLALDAGRKGYAVGERALLTFGNDGGERAAAIAQTLQGNA